MPTYDYKCKACEHELEIFQSMSDAVKRKCPRCGKNGLERKIGLGAAVLFKGSGFYQTDYRSASYKKAAESDKSPESKSESKSETKAESKPESKAESKPETKPPASSKPAGTEGKKKASKPKDAA
jgi:putative FmdB family regulatory protein